MPPNEGAASLEVETRVFRYDGGAGGPTRRQAIAVEAPVQFAFGGVPFAVMMATPRDLVDFAYGFSLTEGMALTLDDIRAVEVAPERDGWVVNVALAAQRMQAHLARGRAMSARTGCGLCGVADLADLPAPERLPTSAPIAPAAIGRAIRALDENQPLNRLTRAAHAAAWCGRDGAIGLMREDVGRHNALDKAIGALARGRVAPDSGFFVITSRCSFEMVMKAAAFGASTLVAVSAPTSLALERARALGLTLIAVARADRALTFEGGRIESTGGTAA